MILLEKGMLDFKGFLRMVVKLTRAPENPEQIINAFRVFRAGTD
jgi:Ca2+-binding EF-hand superfamily protein